MYHPYCDTQYFIYSHKYMFSMDELHIITISRKEHVWFITLCNRLHSSSLGHHYSIPIIFLWGFTVCLWYTQLWDYIHPICSLSFISHAASQWHSYNVQCISTDVRWNMSRNEHCCVCHSVILQPFHALKAPWKQTDTSHLHGTVKTEGCSL